MQPVTTLPSGALLADEPNRAEYRKVLGNGRTADRERRRELSNRLVSGSQRGHELAPDRVGDRPEDVGDRRRTWWSHRDQHNP